MADGPQSPCSPECQERSATCHATCRRYAQYAEKRERYRQERHLRNEVYSIANAGAVKAVNKQRMRKKAGRKA